VTRDFSAWLSSFRPSISGYRYYIDFDKVVRNVDEIKVELNILNALIGSKTIEDDFERIIRRYPETIQCIPLLIAVRAKDCNYKIYAQDEDGAYLYDFRRMNYSCDQYKVFMRKTGLFDLLENHLVNNLVDYALGVETGLDSNGRKNRGGHQMEDLVEGYLRKTGKQYFKEMYLSEIERRWGFDLSALSNQGQSTKRFDFVVKTASCVYAIETNFYSSGGSKLNETARSYKMLAEESAGIHGFKFVWLTDGIGWISARGNLKETFDVLPTIYNIAELETGVLNEVFV